jgi:murein DD-endopeptidase MepM/ murein hydrolase activator NlpD
MKPLSYRHLSPLLLFLVLFNACKTGPVNLFKTASPHEQYQRKLSAAGLDKTAMGLAWINAGQESLTKAVRIKIPYKEQGYFPAENVPATAFRFNAVRGQKLNISLDKTPASGFMVYMDLWEIRPDEMPKLVSFADTLSANIIVDIEETKDYLLRLQPELLKSGSYVLEIISGPSLGFPVKDSGRKRIESMYGVGRDANTRKHEGIDIFDVFHTPVVASADGIVTRVGENNLGGRVVFMRPNTKNYTLYYAHLDKQLATEGQQVKLGDTLGLMGNTGNARTTPPHLHFGIYTNGGAIDPLPFVNPVIQQPSPLTAAISNLNATMRSTRKAVLRISPDNQAGILETLNPNTITRVEAATSNWYKATLPNGSTGYIEARFLAPVKSPIRTITLNSRQVALLDQPNSGAPVKKVLQTESKVELLGSYQDYLLVKDEKAETGWIVSGK